MNASRIQRWLAGAIFTGVVILSFTLVFTRVSASINTPPSGSSWNNVTNWPEGAPAENTLGVALGDAEEQEDADNDSDDDSDSALNEVTPSPLAPRRIGPAALPTVLGWVGVERLRLPQERGPPRPEDFVNPFRRAILLAQVHPATQFCFETNFVQIRHAAAAITTEKRT